MLGQLQQQYIVVEKNVQRLEARCAQSEQEAQEAPRDEAEERLARGSAVASELRRAVLRRAGYTCSCGDLNEV